MGIDVVAAGPDGVTLGAPLEPSINHRDTVFGGSAAAVAILSAWGLLFVSVKVSLRCGGEQVGELDAAFVALELSAA